MSRLRDELMKLTDATKRRIDSEQQQEQQKKDDLRLAEDMEQARKLILALPDKMRDEAQKNTNGFIVVINDIRLWHPDAVEHVTEYLQSHDLLVAKNMNNDEDGPVDGSLQLIATWV